ncbi:hypothetical protein EON62_01110 [archaeon]|nr:MAG: hypothetical protein EON62_01110 [archaeon]
MSDVWLSQDGSDWQLRNAGCDVPSTLDTKWPGTKAAQCATDDDCYAKRFGNAACVNRVCVCRHWSPRERFAVTAANASVFLAGGVTYVQKSWCAHHACGSEYAVALNDVWRTDDGGATWRLLIAAAPWSRRADFALAYLTASATLWLVGGREYDVTDPDVNLLRNDVWRSSDAGVTWVQNSSTSPWPARCGHFVVADSSRLFLGGGQVEVPRIPKPPLLDAAAAVDYAAAHAITNVHRPRPTAVPIVQAGERVMSSQLKSVSDVWVVETAPASALLSLPQAVIRPSRNETIPRPQNLWIQDYEPRTPQHEYITAASDVAWLRVEPDVRERLLAAGMTDIGSVASMSSDAVARFRNESDWNVTSICDLRATAVVFMDRCVPKFRPPQDFFMRSITFEDASTEPVPDVVVDTGCLDVHPHVPAFATQDICRQRWEARAFGAGLLMNGVIYTLGGYAEPGLYLNDVWYRDDRNPSTLIVRAPADETDELHFEFTADEPYCTFEYRYGARGCTGGDGVLHPLPRCTAPPLYPHVCGVRACMHNVRASL